MTWIPGPKHSQSPQISGKKCRPSVCKWSLGWHVSLTSITLVGVQQCVSRKVLGPIPSGILKLPT